MASKKGEFEGPNIKDHALAKWDQLRQSFSGSGPIESTSTVESPNQVWPVKLAIYQRGGERIALELPNGMNESVDSKDIIHWLGVNDSLLGRFRANNPISGFRIVPQSNAEI